MKIAAIFMVVAIICLLKTDATPTDESNCYETQSTCQLWCEKIEGKPAECERKCDKKLDKCLKTLDFDDDDEEDEDD
ncbi:unnamed protein product [Calicophoron daubneyi]|uniref:Uncharacterized protein n=1 Tax=Calicophoron daubneyi TaxID=300641 RepID=A0AAV2TIQ3_CALDB